LGQLDSGIIHCNAADFRLRDFNCENGITAATYRMTAYAEDLKLYRRRSERLHPPLHAVSLCRSLARLPEARSSYCGVRHRWPNLADYARFIRPSGASLDARNWLESEVRRTLTLVRLSRDSRHFSYRLPLCGVDRTCVARAH